MAKTESRSRAWFITILYDIKEKETRDEAILKDITEIRGLKTIYECDSVEAAPTTGTIHIHAWVYFKSDKTFARMKKLFPRARLDESKATNGVGARDYIRGHTRDKGFKENETFSEQGEQPRQGKRSDIDEIKDIVTAAGTMRDVVPVARSIQAIRYAEIHMKYFEHKRNWKTNVKWFYGATGTGKSHQAFSEAGEDAHECMDTSKWWEGYDGHETVIIDDMRTNFCSFSNLLRLLDKYPYRVECKGGSRQFLAKTIYITTTKHPKEMYDRWEGEDVNQLLRRIDEIREFTEKYEYM